MSSIVEKTFPQVNKIIEEKGGLIVSLSKTHPKATEVAVKSEIKKIVGYGKYKQGDIELLDINIFGDKNSTPIVEYKFILYKHHDFGLNELDRLLKKYKGIVKEVEGGKAIMIPIHEEGKKIGDVGIYVGCRAISIFSSPDLQHLLKLSKEVESIFQEVYEPI